MGTLPLRAAALPAPCCLVPVPSLPGAAVAPLSCLICAALAPMPSLLVAAVAPLSCLLCAAVAPLGPLRGAASALR